MGELLPLKVYTFTFNSLSVLFLHLDDPMYLNRNLQTVQAVIRLLYKEQFDQSLTCLRVHQQFFIHQDQPAKFLWMITVINEDVPIFRIIIITCYLV